MNEIMNWVTHYNTQIIQVVFSVILVLVIVYLYRLFFSASASGGSLESSADMGEVNKKLSQLLNQQKAGASFSTSSAPAHSSTSSVSENSQSYNNSSVSSGAQAEEVAQLTAELAKLRAQLNESEKKVFEMTPAMNAGDSAAGGAAPSATEAAFGVAAGASSADSTAAVAAAKAESKVQMDELTQKIEQLQSRLSEYDIIADDIAELSQLRTENAELKKKLGASSAAPVAPVETAAAADEAAAAIANSAFTDLNVPEIEKNSMSDFEKSTQKGE